MMKSKIRLRLRLQADGRKPIKREREDPNKIEEVAEETINLGENKEENHYQHVEEESEAEEVDPNDLTGRLPPLRRPKLN